MEILCLLAGGVLATASSSSSLNSSGSTALRAGTNYREVNVDYDDVADADVESMMEEIEVHVRETPYDARLYDVDVDVDGDPATAVDNRMENVCEEKLRDVRKKNEALRKKNAHAVAQKLLWKSLYRKKVKQLEFKEQECTLRKNLSDYLTKTKDYETLPKYGNQSDATNTIKMYKWEKYGENKFKVQMKNVKKSEKQTYMKQGWDTKIVEAPNSNTKQSTSQQKDSK